MNKPPSIFDQMAMINPMYYVFAILAFLAYAILQAFLKYKVDVTNPDNDTIKGQYGRLWFHFWSVPILVPNVITFILAITLVLYFPLTNPDPGTLDIMTIAKIVGPTLGGQAAMISILSKVYKIGENTQKTADDKNLGV